MDECGFSVKLYYNNHRGLQNMYPNLAARAEARQQVQLIGSESSSWGFMRLKSNRMPQKG
jgi:hypothetical protein